jgi:hypothetical protein
MLLVYALRRHDCQQSQRSLPHDEIKFTGNQKDWLDQAWKYARKETGHGKASQVILGLSCALWGPESIQHLMADTFNDVVIQFAIYSNLLSTGALNAPNVISSFLARIKYIMRLTTIEHAITQQGSDDKW